MEHMLSREIISRENSFEADAIMLIGVIYIEDLSCAQETGIESIIWKGYSSKKMKTKKRPLDLMIRISLTNFEWKAIRRMVERD